MSSAPRDDDRPATTDPVLVRRRQMARGALVGQRGGYTLFAVAIALFFYGFATGLTDGLVVAIVVAMGVGSVMLAPAIVVSYAVKAAERDDRERGLDS